MAFSSFAFTFTLVDTILHSLQSPLFCIFIWICMHALQCTKMRERERECMHHAIILSLADLDAPLMGNAMRYNTTHVDDAIICWVALPAVSSGWWRLMIPQRERGEIYICSTNDNIQERATVVYSIPMVDGGAIFLTPPFTILLTPPHSSSLIISPLLIIFNFVMAGCYFLSSVYQPILFKALQNTAYSGNKCASNKGETCHLRQS